MVSDLLVVGVFSVSVVFTNFQFFFHGRNLLFKSQTLFCCFKYNLAGCGCERCSLFDRVDLGTSDPVSLDVLINALTNVSSE